jgi:hypothetical protein
MNAQLNLDQMGLTDVSFEEASLIDGGTYASGYSAGQAAGVAVNHFLTGVLLIAGIIALF